MSVDAARLERLLDRYLDEALTPEERTELEQTLRAAPQAREMFWQHTRFHAVLREFGAEFRGRELAVEPSRWRALAESFGGFRIHPGWVVAAATVLFAVATIWWVRREAGRPVDGTTTGVAVLTQAIDLAWAPGAQMHATGAALSPGWLRLQSGLAQIEFSDGARVLLEGPAELQVISRGEAFCRSGRLSVQVPPAARGFKVSTPKLAVVDLGTAFGLVAGEGSTELHVFEGKVKLEGAGAPKAELVTGEALAVDAGGHWRQFAASAALFPDATALQEKARFDWQRRKEAWRTYSNALRSDPTLLACYLFEGDSRFEPSLRNAVTGSDRASDGAIVGCRWVEGRWPGKNALEFKGTGGRVRLESPGAFDALTLATWVRVDSLDSAFSSLLMADAFDAGGMHWQITKNGSVRLGIQGPQNRGHQDCNTPAIFGPERLGQWVHLAVVIDRVTHRVAHYVDGREVSAHTLKFDVPLGFGRAEIGNWNPATRRDSAPIRSLNGRMDELLVFRRALDVQEVRSLSQPSPQISPALP